MSARRGPPPKDPEKRVRRNKQPHALTVEAPAPKPPTLAPTYLADGERVKYLADTRRWWKNWRSSPMTCRFEASDWERLLMLARQVDAYYRTANPKYLAEIRQTEAELGGTVASRMRLQVQIVRPDGDPINESTSTRRAGLHVVA